MSKFFTSRPFLLALGAVALVTTIILFSDLSSKREPQIVESVEDDASSDEINNSLPPPFKAADEAQVDPALVGYRKPNDSAMLLEVKELRARDWRVGDELAVVIPHTGYTLETRIEEVQETMPGIVTIKSYPDETMANYVLLTVSSKNTFMSLFTPDGEYELVGGQEYGWLVPSASLPGPTADDFVLIEGPTVREAPPLIEPEPFDE